MALVSDVGSGVTFVYVFQSGTTTPLVNVTTRPCTKWVLQFTCLVALADSIEQGPSTSAC